MTAVSHAHNKWARQEAIIPTLIEHLATYMARPEVVEQMEEWKAHHKDSLNLIRDFFGVVNGLVKHVAELPPSPGYEPWIVERGGDRIVARGLAHLFVHHGNRISKEREWLPTVVEAIQFLSKPRRSRPAIIRKVDTLLSAWKNTSIIEEICLDAEVDDCGFVRLLESVADGHRGDYPRLTETAASLVPSLRTRRGRRVSAASAAHEFLLEDLAPVVDPRAYTWSDEKEDFVDPVTTATRREFGDPDFDPRPARRRVKARKKLPDLPDESS